MIKAGIIGCGGIANQKHLPTLKLFEKEIEIVALCDIVEERATKAAKKFGSENAKVYTDYKELLKDDSIDVVYVLTPNVSHAPITVDAFAAKKHVFCEKPMAHTSKAAKEMIEAWKKSGKKFTIGYQNRYRDEVLSLKKQCDNGDLGDVYFGKAHAIRRRAVPTWGVFPDKSQQGGGPLIDIGTHALDITLWMMDNYKPVKVTGTVFNKMGNLPSAVEGNLFGPWDPETYEVEDSAFGMVKFENGASVYIEASWAINMLESKEAATTLCGTKAGAEIKSGMSFKSNELIINKTSGGLLTQEHLSSSGNIAFFEGGAESPQARELKNWLEALNNDKEPMVDPQQAYVVTRILEAIYQSHETNQEIDLSGEF